MSVLLVTSRESKRWVIPKGNRSSGTDPHVAAAVEAEEEAGVRGAVCPTPLGSFRYRKTRKTGASLMFDVDVYPLAVTQELDHYKEADQRERRWFSLGDAADAVEEPDLATLIRSFDATEFNRAARRRSMLGNVADSSKVSAMFAWFQRLLPKTGNFFDLFEKHSETLVAAAGAVCRALEGSPSIREHLREVNEREHDADNVIREVLTTVRRTFLTPFDRSSITSLIGAMDDSIDEMQSLARAIDIYDVRTFEPEMRDMAASIMDSARLTSEAMPLLRDVGANAARLHELTERFERIKSHADEIHAAGLKRAFGRFGHVDTPQFIVARELFKHLERVVDAFGHVGYEIDGLVIDHA